MTGNVLLPGCRERVWEPGEDYERHTSGLWIPGELIEPEPAPPLLGVDLFAGCGGMSCGLHQAGIHVIGASEAWHAAAATYLVNLGSPDTLVHVLPFVEDKMHGKRDRQIHQRYEGQTVPAAEIFDGAGTGWITAKRDHAPEECPQCTHLEGAEAKAAWCETYHAVEPLQLPCEHLWLGDVRALTGERMLADLGLEFGSVDMVVGGPPCQGFSLAGKRQVVDPRNSLVFEFARLVLEMHPRAMIMENVPGIVSMVTPEGIPVVDALARVLEDGGFGAYDSLRKSILTTAGCGGAVRGKRVRDEAEPVDEDGPTGSEVQLDLLENAA